MPKEPGARGFKIVFGNHGSGYNPDGSPFYSWGDGKYATVHEFENNPHTTAMRRHRRMMGCTNDNVIDGHFWIEDSEGRVYDIVCELIHNNYVASAAVLKRVVDANSIINGVHKRTLSRACGIHYVEAPQDVQRFFVDKARSNDVHSDIAVFESIDHEVRERRKVFVSDPENGCWVLDRRGKILSNVPVVAMMTLV